jgi:hypothetical protein
MSRLVVGDRVTPDLDGVAREKILNDLERVLASTQFHSSRKCTRFLRHIVECTLDQQLDRLKERTIGVDVFERDALYDTNQDPVVRGTAGEVRKRLAQYYLASVQPDEVRFSLPAGSYVPEINVSPLPLASLPSAAQRPVFSPVPNSAAPAGVRRPSWRGALPVLAVLAVSAVVAISLLYRPVAPLTQFWDPVLAGKRPILVCIGQPKEYTFRPETANALDSWFSRQMNDSPAEVPFSNVPIGQILPLWQNSVSLADAQSFARMYSLFARRSVQADLRGDRSVSLSDLRERSSVMVGAFNNQWTLNLQGELRFYFENDSRNHSQLIRDRLNPTQTRGLIEPWPPSSSIKTDYALVTRFHSHTTEQMILMVGGIAQYGTEAAAEFVTNPSYFSEALKNAPPDWRNKNMQILLSTRVLSQTGGPPRVLATYFW